MNMKKITTKIFAGLCLILLSIVYNQAQACHLAAADIYIEYAGVGVDVCNPVPDYTYRVTMVTYSSCDCGLTTGATERLYYESDNDGSGQHFVDMTSPGIVIVDELCPAFAAISQCHVPANNHLPAFRSRTYTATFTLPSGQRDWKFWWSSSARNASVNLNGFGSLYIEAGMDVLANFYNNTPRFLSNPLPYICVNQEYEYLNLPWDPDEWDSNRVNVITTVPMTSATATVTYNTGYNVNRPINAYSLNNSTGTATFFPDLTGKYTLSFRANDKHSYVIRDVQIAVLPCTAPPPDMDSIAQNLTNATLVPIKRNDPTGKIDHVVYVCPESEFTFSMNGWTENPDNELYMRTDLALFTGATFNVSGEQTDKVTGTFKWRPTTADYGQHILVITTVDSTCTQDQPIVLTTKEVVLIQVVPGIDAGPDQVICELNPQPIQLFVKGTNNLKVTWTTTDGGPVIGFNTLNIHNPTINYPFFSGNDTIFYPKTAGYIVSTVDLTGTCRNRDTVYVSLDTSNTVNITPKNPVNPEDALVMCKPGYMQLEALIKGKKPLNNVPCSIGNPTLCNTPETLTMYGSPVYGEAFYDTVGNATPVMYQHLQTAKKEYLVKKEDIWQWGMRSATIRGLAFEIDGNTTPTHEYNNFSISIKCTNKSELNPEEGFENFGMTQVYSSTAVTLPNGWNDFKFGTPYNWDTTKNLVIQICYNSSTVLPCNPANPVPVIKYASTSYPSALSYKPADGSVSSVCGTGKVDGIAVANARPVFRFLACEADPLPFDIRWRQGELLSDSTIAQPLAYVPKSTTFIVQTIGLSKCIMRDTMEVYIPEHDMRVQPEDTSLCLGDKAPFVIFGGHYFKWYEYINDEFVEPGSIDEPAKGYTFAGPQRSTEYRIVVSDSVWCYDTLSARIKILPLPDVRILNQDDTVVKYGQSFQLLASGARMYNWSPVSSLNNPNISYPIARPTEDTKYILGGLAANGCRAFDTLHVIVDKRDNLFVPSAFSPNGDGKNDLFKITNLTFQRIMEFRVFNRWGQEIYSTNDHKAGWDGTWKGVPQEMGTYSYLIRVAYPDGFVETYKGETTLVR
jgi:gliding motility-associated-like protein